MRILLISHKFSPDIGGIEEMSRLLAAGFVSRGHAVTVVTHTRSEDGLVYPFAVSRAPRPAHLLRLHRSADVVFHNNIALRFAWPLLLGRRPWVVAVRTWIRRNDMRIGFRDAIKRGLLRRARVIANSQAVAADLGADSVVVPNSYNDDIFRVLPGTNRRPRSIAFVGRLVEAKGAHVLIEAVARLRAAGIDVSASIIGDGGEHDRLRALVAERGLQSEVRFLGRLQREKLNAALNEHEFLAVPSVWPEPFGIVALEGMASGCVPIVTAGGGLPGAVGDAGLVVQNGDEESLADAIAKLIREPELLSELRSKGVEHIKNFTADSMVERYLDVIERAR